MKSIESCLHALANGTDKSRAFATNALSDHLDKTKEWLPLLVTALSKSIEAQDSTEVDRRLFLVAGLNLLGDCLRCDLRPDDASFVEEILLTFAGGSNDDVVAGSLNVFGSLGVRGSFAIEPVLIPMVSCSNQLAEDTQPTIRALAVRALLRIDETQIERCSQMALEEYAVTLNRWSIDSSLSQRNAVLEEVQRLSGLRKQRDI